MTNHWRDIKNADLILINGANPAEAHPVGFQWFMRAKLDRGAKIIHADPRFTRTSAVADMYLRIRTGTDVAYFGGLINYVLQNNLYHDEYVKNYTNASFIVSKDYSFNDGLFSATIPRSAPTKADTWAYESRRRPASPSATTRCRIRAASSSSSRSTTRATRLRWSRASPASPSSSTSRSRSSSARWESPTR